MEINELLQGLREGKSAVQKEFFATYSGPIYKWVCYNYIAGRNGRSKHQAEDVLQDTFVIAFSAISRFKSDNKNALISWLHAIAGNVANALFSTKRKLKYMDLDDETGERILEIPDSKITVDILYATAESNDIINKYLSKLNKNQKIVIFESFTEGRSNKEIGELLGKSEDAIKKIKRRAIAKLERLILSDSYFENVKIHSLEGSHAG